MPKRAKKRFKMRINSLGKREKYAILITLMFIVMGSASFAFETYAFGYESIWGADVQFDSIKFGNDLYESPEELPEYAFNIGSRTITADFDTESFDWSTAPAYWSTTGIAYDDVGMHPTVNYDLSRFKYYSNLTEELDESQAYFVYDNTDDSIDVHFYFGFSIMFSTSAYTIPMPALEPLQSPHAFIPSPDSTHGWGTLGYVESGEVEMTTTVALRFEALLEDSDFQYTGTLNEITVIGERSYYVTQPPGESYDTIADFNSNYDWKSLRHVVKGYAEAVGEPRITYNVINSETEKMATIEATARLRPALDPVVTEEVDIPSGSLEGYIMVDGIDIFNVGFIYDVVADVSINDIPLYDETALLALGRFGINLPIPPPEPWYLSPIILIAVAVISFVIFRRK